MTSNSASQPEEFLQAVNYWYLDKLYIDLSSAKGKRLTPTEKKLLRGILCGYSPAEIAEKVYKTKSANAVRVSLSNGLYRYIEDLLIIQGRQEVKIKAWNRVANLLEQAGYKKLSLFTKQAAQNKHQDWGDAVDVSIFFGRQLELAQLSNWIIVDRCRLVALLGIGGIGKTSLSIKLAQQVQDDFEYLIWLSLRNAPVVEEVLAKLINFVSHHQKNHLPETVHERISYLLDYLRSHRCLILLDNAETILSSGNRAGDYLPGYQGYGELFQRLGDASHQSCLILTSREKPKQIVYQEGDNFPVRSLQLYGLQENECKQILRAKGVFDASENELCELIIRYSGNPLALKIIATAIQDLFDNNISEFISQGTSVFGDIRDLLSQQFNRLSSLETEVMYWLAINREPVSLQELKSDLISPVSSSKLLEVLESLLRRCLIEKSREAKFRTSKFTQQPVVMEYVTECLIENVFAEIVNSNVKTYHGTSLQFLQNYALMKATSVDYVRETQIRLIIQPLISQLRQIFITTNQIENHLQNIVKIQQQEYPLEPGYISGNIINLLCQLQVDLTGYNFSHLAVWQAYLKDTTLHNVNFQNADLTKSIFIQTNSYTTAIAFSANGKILATGGYDGVIRLWRVADGQQILAFPAHQAWIHTLAFSSISPDTPYKNGILASGGADFLARCWNVDNGEPIQTFTGHTSLVFSVNFSRDATTLTTVSSDRSLKRWNIADGRCLQTIVGKDKQLTPTVAYSSDGKTIAIATAEQTLSLWNLSTGECFKTFPTQHNCRITALAFSPDGSILASGSASADPVVNLWDISDDKCLASYRAHSFAISCLAFSPDGKILASSSTDHSIRLWEIKTGKCCQILQSHVDAVQRIAFTPDGQTLASSSYDQSVKLWDTSKGQVIRTLRGYVNDVRSVAIHQTSKGHYILASAHRDSRIRIWNLSLDNVEAYHGTSHDMSDGTSHDISHDTSHSTSNDTSYDEPTHSKNVSAGNNIASNNANIGKTRHVQTQPVQTQPVQTPNVQTQPVQTRHVASLHGHRYMVASVAISPDGKTLVSGGEDETAKLWDIATGEILHTWEVEGREVWSVTFSPDGKTIAAGCDGMTLANDIDRDQVRLWNVENKSEKILSGHHISVNSVAFSPDGNLLASGSTDGTINLWDVSTGRLLKNLQGNSGLIYSVAFSPISIATPQGSGQIIASCDYDGFIKVWNVDDYECQQINRVDNRPVFCIAFCPTDSNIIASPSFGNSIKLWSVSNSECKQTLEGHNQEILSLAWSRDGKILVSSSLDETIKIWNIKTGYCLKSLRSLRPLEGTNITGVTGITQATVQTLKKFGARNANSR